MASLNTTPMIIFVFKVFFSKYSVNYTPFTPTHGCCGSRRMLYPSRSARDRYCMRTVSVLCLWISAAIRSPILKVISCFTYAADAADKVSPYWLRTLSVLPPPASVLCPRRPYSLRRPYFRDEDAYGVESNSEGVCKRFVTVASC